MATYDTHITVDDSKVAQLLKKSLSLDYTEVVGSSQSVYPKAVFTIAANSQKQAIANHDKYFNLVSTLKEPVLLETEADFSLENIAKTQEPASLITEERDATRLHWGDLHLRVPLDYTTRTLREHFQDLGYQHIVVVKPALSPCAVITCQFSRELLTTLTQQMRGVSDQKGYDISKAKFWGERLLRFDTFYGAQPLPITTGTKSV